MVNNSSFLIKEIPKFHAVSQRYDRMAFWKTEKEKCINGAWFGGKWCPGPLYFFINYFTIRFESEDGIVGRKIGRPFFRDIEWERAYVSEEAMGFSGFTNDNKYTCNRNYGPEKEKAIKYGWMTEELAKSKIYIPAREYLRRVHPENMGNPIYHNQAKNILQLTSRGTGKSYYAASEILHNFLFDGATDYSVYLNNRLNSTPMASDTVAGAIESKYVDDLLKKVKVAIEHLPDRQIINGELYPSPLFVGYTGSFASGKAISSQTGSVINVRTFADDPLAANGTRPNKAFIEECGFMNNFIEVIGALESTQASSDNKNLVIHALGTGGLTSHGAVTFNKEVFYNPEEFNFLAFDDIWENKGKIGFFISGEYGINKFKYGPNKITDVDRANEYINEEIEIARKSGNRRKYMAEIINKPLKPSDIFLTLEGNFFPIDDLRERLGEIENNKRTLEASWKVEFYIVSGKVEWKLSGKPILREFPHRRGDILDTAIEVYELPKMDSNDTIPYGRYLASLDPVDNDGGDDTEHSLLCGFILDSWTDRIVVEYTGRTRMTEDFYEQWRRCLIYFNAICNYERNLKGFYPHMKNSNSLHYLCDQPQILMEKGLAKGDGAVGNQTKGTHCTTPIANWGLELILSYLGAKAYEQPYVDPDKPDEAIYIKNLHNLKSPALIQELIAYNSEINADRVSSLVLLMILREDRLNISKSAFGKKVDTVTKNKFWDKAYKSFGQKNKFLDNRITHMKN